MRWWNSGNERLRRLSSFLRARLAMNWLPDWHGVYMAPVSASDFIRYINRKRAQISLGNALTATLQTENARYAFRWHVRREQIKRHVALWDAATEHCPRRASRLAYQRRKSENVTRDPLAEARRVLVVGQGGEADNREIAMLAERWEPKWATVGHE